jgi:hypothetical protein
MAEEAIELSQLIETGEDGFVRLAREILSAGPLWDPRSLTGEQLMMAQVLADALRDIESTRHRGRECARRALAGAWITGRHACGCEYDTVVTFEDVARALRQDPDWLRSRVLESLGRDIQIVGGEVRSRFVHEK